MCIVLIVGTTKCSVYRTKEGNIKLGMIALYKAITAVDSVGRMWDYFRRLRRTSGHVVENGSTEWFLL